MFDANLCMNQVSSKCYFNITQIIICPGNPAIKSRHVIMTDLSNTLLCLSMPGSRELRDANDDDMTNSIRTRATLTIVITACVRACTCACTCACVCVYVCEVRWQEMTRRDYSRECQVSLWPEKNNALNSVDADNGSQIPD